MELLTIQEAVQRAKVSDKTLRRAIEDGLLVAQPRLHPNKPILITEQDLERYIASRQPVQISEAVQAGRIDELEEIVENVTRLSLETQAETEALRTRVIALEKALLTNREQTTVLPGLETSSHVQMPRTKGFTLADFSQQWQEEYRCEAIQGDVKAMLILRPHVALDSEHGLYHVDSLDWQPTRNKRKIPNALRERGKVLQEALASTVQEAMSKAGWTLAGTTSDGKPLYKSV